MVGVINKRFLFECKGILTGYGFDRQVKSDCFLCEKYGSLPHDTK
jgi:hypothetical protein